MSEYLIDLPDRDFQIWAYSVSMGRLLLRSTKNEVLSTRIDILFQDVRAISLAASLPGLVMSEAVGDLGVMKSLGSYSSGKAICYQIQSGSYFGHIVASAFVHNEDEGEFFDPSVLWPSGFGV
ncbi:hypothetical protein [Microbacterium sp. USTB-Y]|uniref:hypothetical protein n=1 Tax=Microbacterium sp. USTB-Y TaxID=2823692 RepID=UPI0020400316|nr:hypothetical protein [Microbacterium sp. USTB-Y]